MNEKLIALSINGRAIDYAPGFKAESFSDLGAVISQGLDLAIYLAGVVMFGMALWGIVQYILAGGDKEGLAKARKRITWAIAGFIITIMAFAISSFIKGALPVQDVQIKSINYPGVKQEDTNRGTSGGVQ